MGDVIQYLLLSLQFSSLQGQALESSVAEPAAFDISSPIEYELVLETSTSLVLRPLECWLSTGDVTQYPRGYFVENG